MDTFCFQFSVSPALVLQKLGELFCCYIIVTCQFLSCFCNNFIPDILFFHLGKHNISHVPLPSPGASAEHPGVSLVAARQLQCTSSPVLLLTCIFSFTFASGHGLALKRSCLYPYMDAIVICYLKHKGVTFLAFPKINCLSENQSTFLLLEIYSFAKLAAKNRSRTFGLTNILKLLFTELSSIILVQSFILIFYIEVV